MVSTVFNESVCFVQVVTYQKVNNNNKASALDTWNLRFQFTRKLVIEFAPVNLFPFRLYILAKHLNILGN